MNNFKSGGPGGLRNRKEFIGGRPKSDANYGAKKSFDKKPRFESRGGDRKSFGNDKPREMFKATCANCGKACEVPFKPGGTKPVLCSECFGKNKSDDRNGNDRRESRDDRSQRGPQRSFGSAHRGERGESRGPSPDYKAFQQQVAALENKVNEMLEILKAQEKAQKSAAKVAKVSEEEKEEKPKKAAAKKVAKKAVKKVAKKTK